MTMLLEIKEIIMQNYRKFERIIVPLAKFIMALVVLSLLGRYLSGFDLENKFVLLDKFYIKVAMAAIVAFVPGTWFVLLIMVTLWARIFFISIEATFIVFGVTVIIYLMFIRLFPKQAYLVILLPFLIHMKLAYVLPLFAGLFLGPVAIVPIGVGVVVYYLGMHLPGILQMTSVDLYDMPTTIIEMYKYTMNILMGNRAMLLTIVVFLAVIVTTYYVGRLELDFAQYIAVGVGGLVNIFGFIMGNLVLNAGVQILGVLIGSFFAVFIVCIMQFFRFTLDYQKTERQQFEDEDFYYYVKAIPKIKLSKSKREIKTIE
ncbi:hypothetical protein [Petrocella sp. FN5]|uniref:hypothetical protein n=1 Tax=Petrocella sp. FN5 TaxID=3032002 RepID=UPI0023DA25B4|nr:hypothetical protein [Petrocella sp. FN5]MDF1617345.1 hypothetical protein [Petrocella sp. FN5]